MRNLTIGVLIIIGGTLAALPFRRYAPIPDPSSLPEEATGPTMSSLQGTNLEIVESRQIPRIDTLTTTQLPQWRPEPQAETRRGVPMRYEDLAVPVGASEPSAVKFPASVSAQEEATKTERRETETALNSDPPMQPMAVNIPPKNGSIRRVLDPSPQHDRFVAIANLAPSEPKATRVLTTQRVPVVEQETQEATAQLVSSNSQQESTPKLPNLRDRSTFNKTPEVRQRHWIRQPD